MENLYNIYLVGFMGTGKSVVGKALSRELGFAFADIDALIVKKEKRSISEIFRQDGESYFRKFEKEVLESASAKPGQVISCGGGVILDSKNIETMKKAGKIAALSARPEVILKRIAKSSRRPLLDVADPAAKINELLLARKPYYAKADFNIDTSDLSIAQVVEAIRKLISNG